MHVQEQDPETIYAKAAKAELAKDFDLALKLYIKAAEDFLHQSRTTTDAKMKSHCKTRVNVALQRAEKIKSVIPDLIPVVRDPFSEQSQFSVLKKSSRVDGKIIRLWNDPRSLESELQSQPDLSSSQIDRASVWKCLAELSPQPFVSHDALRPYDISQRVVTDCSLCASIIVCIEHHRRFLSRLCMSSLFPQDEHGIPCSISNTYEARFQFNGALRRIIIDDKLPVSSLTNELTCLFTGSSRVYWPALIEKAYLKLMGGYEFPGSNSSIDLHTLIGWIPETLGLKCPTFPREKSWNRLMEGFTTGRCILTMGTLDRDDIFWRNVHMLPAHCYAVTDLSESDGERYATVLDTWSQNTQELPLPNPESHILRMTWDEVCQVFEDAYVSWDPASFKHCLSFHGIWKRTKNPVKDGIGQHQHLRLRISPPSTNTVAGSTSQVWVLLTRHISETRRVSDYIALRVESEFDKKIEQRVDEIAQKGTFTNSCHVLVQAAPREVKSCALSLIASYDGDLEEVGFTLTVYSTTDPISWDKHSNKLLYCDKIEGSFTSKTAGGNHSFPSYMSNPQYHLRVHSEDVGTRNVSKGRGEKAKMTFVGQTSKDIPLNVCVAWSDGGRVFDLVQSDVVATSGAYGYGYAAAAGELLPGDYTIILSSFEPQHHLGPFSLQVDGSRRFEIKLIPQEGAGMYNKVIKGAWKGDSAAGSPSFKRYLENPTFVLNIVSTSQLKVRLQLIEPTPSILLNVSIFPIINGQSSSIGQHIATSGPYTDSMSGVVTPLTTLQPGNYLIVASTFHAGIEKPFKVELFYSAAGLKIEPRKRANIY